MSDVRTGGQGPCPACDGGGETRLGPLTLQCEECGGSGQAGGDAPPVGEDGYRAPMDGEEYDPDIHGPLPAATGFLPWRLPPA